VVDEMIFLVAVTTYLAASMIHGRMPYWYLMLCFVIWDIAALTPVFWIQFELVSILGVVAMSRDLHRKGII